jgi:hypothetical protein
MVVVAPVVFPPVADVIDMVIAPILPLASVWNSAREILGEITSRRAWTSNIGPAGLSDIGPSWLTNVGPSGLSDIGSAGSASVWSAWLSDFGLPRSADIRTITLAGERVVGSRSSRSV